MTIFLKILGGHGPLATPMVADSPLLPNINYGCASGDDYRTHNVSFALYVHDSSFIFLTQTQARSLGGGQLTPSIQKIALKFFRLIKILMWKSKKYYSAN